MSDDVRQRAFEPFFTTKEVGKGSGLGLAQVFGFVKQSGGGIRVETEVGKGTSIHVFLPRAQPLTERTADALDVPANVTPAAHGTLILLVDDDGAVREITAKMLRNLGYDVVEAGSGGAALDLLAREPRISLSVLDYAMPGMSGAEVAHEVHKRRPELPIVFITGYVDLTALKEVGEDGLSRSRSGRPIWRKKLAAASEWLTVEGSPLLLLRRSYWRSGLLASTWLHQFSRLNRSDIVSRQRHRPVAMGKLQLPDHVAQRRNVISDAAR